MTRPAEYPPVVAVPSTDSSSPEPLDPHVLIDVLGEKGWVGRILNASFTHSASGVIAPLQRTVEAIAKLVGGPADGNLVEHVRAMVDGCAKVIKERDEARAVARELEIRLNDYVTTLAGEVEAIRQERNKLRDDLVTLRANLGGLVKR